MAGQRGLAEKIRAGLEDHNEAAQVKSNKTPHYLDELWVRKTIRQHVREFSCVMSLVLCIIAGIVCYKGTSVSTALSLVVAASVMILMGYRAPEVLHPVWKSWMTLATFIGGFMTKLILSLGWVLLVVPFALGMKLFAKRVMDLSYATGVQTYWETRDSKLDDFKLLERQY